MKWSLFIAFLFGVISASAQTMSSEQIIAAHIKAIGGLEIWNKIKTVTLKGIKSDESDVVTFSQRIKINHSIRMDYQIKTRLADMEGKNFFIILTPTNYIEYTPDSLFQDEGTIAAKKQVLLEELDIVDPFINATKRGIKTNYLGTEFYEEQNHYKYMISYPFGKQYYCYINEKDLMIDRMVLVSGELEEQITYKEYEKQKNGILFPKYTLRNQLEKRITSIEINPKFEETIFLKK